MILYYFMITLLVVNVSRVYGVEEKVCGTITVINYIDLDNLTDCTVIVGSLRLAFPLPGSFDNYTSEEVNNRSFPLMEITDYMLVYVVELLDSLGNMFPNLTIIRGQKLFHNYAFVIFSTDLKQITLRNLLKISRGSAKIDGSNERLCLPQIDTDRIIMNGKVFIGKNATSLNCSWMKFDRCNSCEEPYKCWHNNACQRFESTFQHLRKKRCHDYCIGGCVDNTTSGCFVCQDLRENSTCVSQCSDNNFLNPDSRRCIDYDECRNLDRVIFQDECLSDCPPGYSTSLNSKIDGSGGNGSYCIKCPEKCPKTCDAVIIRYVSQLESIGKGCTIINGNLEINMIDDISNISTELQTYLGSIEEIKGSLKIHRSPSIVSLTFLNRLRVIEGDSNTAIQIFENQNLQTTFNWAARAGMKLKLKTGNVYIYRNILLCGNETKNFMDATERTGNHSDLISGNGEKNICAGDTIEAFSHDRTFDSSTVRWKDVNPPGSAKFNAYIIQYISIKSPQAIKDKTFFERDSCSSYGWQQALLKKEDWKYSPDRRFLEFNLTGLNQFTTYAYSIQTYKYGISDTLLNETENDGAISPVKTFRTTLKAPTRVRNLITLKKTSSSITLQWSINENEEDAINHFYIDVVRKPFKLEVLDQRDYCKHPITQSETLVEIVDKMPIDEDNYDSIDDNLPCCEKCCAYEKIRKRIRDVESSDFQTTLLKFAEKKLRKSLEPVVAIRKSENYVDRFYVNAIARHYVVENLESFTGYSFYLHACSNDFKCSDYELVSIITLKNTSESYDKVVLKPASYVFETDNFHIYFDEPLLANGAILNYVIEVKEIAGKKTKSFPQECITRRQHQRNKFKYSLNNLLAGRNYTFRVKAVSLGGDGQFTREHHFSIIQPDNSISKGWILLGTMVTLLIACISIVSYYYKHKIVTMLKQDSDRLVLMKDIEPTDFHNISLRHKSFDTLSDIMEFDD